MRYLFETNLKYIKQAGDIFIICWKESENGTKCAFMDCLGRIFNEKTYYSISERSDGYFEAIPHSSDLTKVLINSVGDEIFACQISSKIKKFDSGIALLKPYRDRNYFLNENGQVLGQELEDVIGFANDIGSVKLANGKYVAVNSQMEIISDEYDYIHPFENPNYSWAINDGKIFIIDRKFSVVSSDYVDEYGNKKPYGYIYHIDEMGIIFSREFRFNSDERNMCSMISIEGKKIGKSHAKICVGSEGIYRVCDEDGTMFVDENGKCIRDEKFINCSDFSEGFAVVGKFVSNDEIVYAFLKKDGTLLGINSSYLKGKPQLSKNWVKFAQDFQEGYGVVGYGGENCHIINQNGIVKKGSYHKLGLFSDGYAKFHTKDKKMSFACKLLQTSTVSEVSEHLGFSSIYSFSRAFKNKYGIPPSEYKLS
jgi:hypothetical protein